MPTKQQLQNDLDAAKTRERGLIESNENLRQSHSLQSHALAQAYRERDDWRDAFKLIMRLVK